MKTYWIAEKPLPGTAVLLCGSWRGIGTAKPVGYVVSIYGGFAPNPNATLKNGFSSKAKLAEYCLANGFAIYWGQPSLNS